MKFIFTIILMLASLSALSADYSCRVTQGENLGEIMISGDPISNIYSKVEMFGKPQLTEAGATEGVYIYILDRRSKKQNFLLEVVNYPISNETFQLSVFGKFPGQDFVCAMRACRVARYICEIQN